MYYDFKSMMEKDTTVRLDSLQKELRGINRFHIEIDTTLRGYVTMVEMQYPKNIVFYFEQVRTGSKYRTAPSHYYRFTEIIFPDKQEGPPLSKEFHYLTSMSHTKYNEPRSSPTYWESRTVTKGGNVFVNGIIFTKLYISDKDTVLSLDNQQITFGGQTVSLAINDYYGYKFHKVSRNRLVFKVLTKHGKSVAGYYAIEWDHETNSFALHNVAMNPYGQLPDENFYTVKRRCKNIRSCKYEEIQQQPALQASFMQTVDWVKMCPVCSSKQFLDPYAPTIPPLSYENMMAWANNDTLHFPKAWDEVDSTMRESRFLANKKDVDLIVYFLDLNHSGEISLTLVKQGMLIEALCFLIRDGNAARKLSGTGRDYDKYKRGRIEILGDKAIAAMKAKKYLITPENQRFIDPDLLKLIESSIEVPHK